MVATMCLEVTYAQLAVFASSLKQPFNDWTDRHVSQGFSWRQGSVSFLSVVEAGQHSIEIVVTDHLGAVRDDATRVIEVPFEVPPDGAIEIGSITETVPLSLPTGAFLLRCEFLQSASPVCERVQLTFAKKDAPRFAIVRADRAITIDGEFLKDAKPAPS